MGLLIIGLTGRAGSGIGCFHPLRSPKRMLHRLHGVKMERMDIPAVAPMHSDLVAKLKACRLCVDRDPDRIISTADFSFDPAVVSHWAQWLGHPHPRLLLVGQDFNDAGYFEQHRAADDSYFEVGIKKPQQTAGRVRFRANVDGCRFGINLKLQSFFPFSAK